MTQPVTFGSPSARPTRLIEPSNTHIQLIKSSSFLTRFSVVLAITLALIAALSPSAVYATDIRQVTKQAMKTTDAGVSAQKNIDQIDDATQALISQHKGKLQQLESLNAYNRQLQGLIDQQQLEHQRLQDEIEQVIKTEREILPLIERMTLALEQFVSLDTPFLPDERANRITKLKQLIQRSDISTAEKFRTILEAYQIENEYGRTLEAYRGQLTSNPASTANNTEIPSEKRTVDFLKIGRVVLLYQTLDGEEAALWSQTSNRWVPITSDLISRSEIKHAFRVARKIAPPDLLMLPVSAPETTMREVSQ